MEKFRNKLIILEGLENVGKSSVGKLLVDYLNNNGIPTIFTFQPGDDAGEAIQVLLRSFCKDKRWELTKEANLYAFMLDRAINMEKVIKPALAEGKTVVLDRSHFSTIAYQLYGKELYNQWSTNYGHAVAESIETWLKNPNPECPHDVVYYFNGRVGNRVDSDNDLFDKEKDEFFNRVERAYNLMAKDNKWKIITNGTSAEDTLKNLLDIAI